MWILKLDMEELWIKPGLTAVYIQKTCERFEAVKFWGYEFWSCKTQEVVRIRRQSLKDLNGITPLRPKTNVAFFILEIGGDIIR